jgi:hypothetical protein
MDRTVLLHNKPIHDNLIALGYEYDGRCERGDDEYSHPANDDWFAINKNGRINPLDVCEFTEGSERGRELLKTKGPFIFMSIHADN